ncbi:TPA: hypothetical protein ACRZZI_004952 [Vibrio harveyi]
MAGFLSGFNQGWGLMDQKIQQDKADQRYEEQQAENQRRYETDLGFRQAQEKRNQQTFDNQQTQFANQQEAYDYEKGLRPQKEKATKLQLQAAELEYKNAQAAAKKQQVNDVMNVLLEDIKGGRSFSPESWDNAVNVTKGTAWDLSKITDPNYTKQLDNADFFMQNPNEINSPEGKQFMNTIFGDEFKDGGMVKGGVSKEFDHAEATKDGIVIWTHTLDGNGNVIKKAPITVDRQPGGKPRIFGVDEIMNSVQAKKMGAASIMANKDLYGQAKSKIYAATGYTEPTNAWGINTTGKGGSGSRGGYGGKIPPQYQTAVDEAKRLYKDYTDALAGKTDAMGQGLNSEVLRMQLKQILERNPIVREFINLPKEFDTEDPKVVNNAINTISGMKFSQVAGSKVSPDQVQADLIQRLRNGEITTEQAMQVANQYGSVASSNNAQQAQGIVNNIVGNKSQPANSAINANERAYEGLKNWARTGEAPAPVPNTAQGLSPEALARYQYQQNQSRGSR